MEKPKLFIDEDVHDKLASVLRNYGFDAVNVRETARKSLSDMEQLNYAVSQQRAIFSFNLVDYEKLAVSFLHQQREHFGIIVSPQRSFTEVLQRLLNLLNKSSAKDLKNQLIYL